MVYKLKADSSSDADFGADEESEPEGEHGGREVNEGGLPVLVEDRWRCDDAPHGDHNDGCERCFGDPEQRGGKLVDGENDQR